MIRTRILKWLRANMETHEYTIDGIEVIVSRNGAMRIAPEQIRKLVGTPTVQRQVEAMRKVFHDRICANT